MIDKESYQHHLDKLNQDLALAELECHDAQLDEIDLEGTLAYAERIALNAARLWAGASLANRQRLQRTLFPEGVVYDTETGFRTPVTCLLFSDLCLPVMA